MSLSSAYLGRAAIVAVFFAFAEIALVPVAGDAAATNRIDIHPFSKDYVSCVYPDPYKLMGGEFAALERLDYYYYGAEPNRWVFISWDAPPGGIVFVLSCDGRVIAKNDLGNVEKVDDGPNVNGKRTVEVRYISGSGTGTLVRSVSLLQFDNAAIHVLWEHEIYDMFAEPQQDGGVRTDTDIFQWQYGWADDKHTAGITVTGTHKIEYNGRTRVQMTRPEKYCYRSDKNKFVRC